MMSLRLRGSYSMEALALVSALCIVAIFVFSHLTRQADSRDLEAYQAAMQVKSAVQAYLAQNPAGKLTKQDLTEKGGVRVPGSLQWEIPGGSQDPAQWVVRVWHPKGRRIYLAGPAKVTEEMR